MSPAGDGRAIGSGAGRVHSAVGVRREGAPGAGARRTRTGHEIVFTSGSSDAELKGCVKLTHKVITKILLFTGCPARRERRVDGDRYGEGYPGQAP